MMPAEMITMDMTMISLGVNIPLVSEVAPKVSLASTPLRKSNQSLQVLPAACRSTISASAAIAGQSTKPSTAPAPFLNFQYT